MSETVDIRVMADSSAAEGVAERIIGVLDGIDGLTLVKRSRPYPCRPPEQGKVRIYLTFTPGDLSGLGAAPGTRKGRR